jgi:hypothetical protein
MLEAREQKMAERQHNVLSKFGEPHPVEHAWWSRGIDEPAAMRK